MVIFAGLPLLLSVLGDLSGGIVTDRVMARFGLRAGRCVVGESAYLLAGTAMLLTSFCAYPVVAVVLISTAVAASMFMLAPAWGTSIDIGRGVGGLLCPLVVAYSLKWYQNWNIPIFLISVLFLIGAACWFVTDPTDQVFREGEEDAPGAP